MESAFGVEHGEISKGLPSALRGAKMGTGIGTETIRVNNRIAANQHGRNAAKYLSHPTKTGEQIASRDIASGKNQKGYFKQGLNGPGGRKLNKPNGFGLQ